MALALGMRMGHVRVCGVRRRHMRHMRMVRMSAVSLGMRQGRGLAAAVAGLHEALLQAVVRGRRLGVCEMSVPVMAVNQLSYFGVLVGDVVAQLRLLEARRGHALISAANARRIRRIEARLYQLFARLRRYHRLQLARGKCVDVTRLAGHQQHHLSTSQRRQLVGLHGHGEREGERRGSVVKIVFTTRSLPLS